jgi:hypothetical protein
LPFCRASKTATLTWRQASSSNFGQSPNSLVPAGAGARAREVLGRRHVVEVGVEVAVDVEAADAGVVVPGGGGSLQLLEVRDDVGPGLVVRPRVVGGAVGVEAGGRRRR